MTSPLDDPTEDLTPVPARDVSKTVEIKVVAAALAVAVASAVLTAIQANTAVLDPLPPWARLVILAAIPPVLAFLAGWATPSNRIGR